MRFQIYRKQEKEKLNNFLRENYGFELNGQIIRQSQDKLRIFTGNLNEHELNILAGTVRVETIGFYLATIEENKENEKNTEKNMGDKNKNKIRFSFDASFLAKDASKNVLELNEQQVKQWFKGEDISICDNDEGSDTDLNKIEKNDEKPLQHTDLISGINSHTDFVKNASYPFVFLKFKEEIVGCGKLTQDKQKILNFVPKERRIKFSR